MSLVNDTDTVWASLSKGYGSSALTEMEQEKMVNSQVHSGSDMSQRLGNLRKENALQSSASSGKIVKPLAEGWGTGGILSPWPWM